MTRTLRIAVAKAAVNFDIEQPTGFRNETTADVFQNVYDQLANPSPTVSAEGALGIDWHAMRPSLAESWQFDDDGRGITFRLRRGVVSHTGNPFTAQDAVFGWHRAFAIRDVGKWVARIASVADEDSVTAVDDHTVHFRLSTRNPAIGRVIAQSAPTMLDSTVVRQHASADDPWAKDWLSGNEAGFGAYRLASFGPEEIALERFDGWWRGPAQIPAASVRTVESIDAAVEALASGRADLVHGVPTALLAGLAARGARIVAEDSSPGLALHLHMLSEPFDDPLVRQAVAHATPYDEIIQTAYLGNARRWSSWLQHEAPGYRGDLWPYPFDLSKARALLAQSRYAGGFDTRLVVRPADGIGVAARILADSLARIGIHASVEDEGARPNIGAALPAPMLLRGQSNAGRGHRVFDPFYTFNHDFGRGRMRLIRYAYENPLLYDALDKVQDGGHGQEYLDSVADAQRILLADAAVIPIAAYRSYTAMAKDVHGYRWYPDCCLRISDLAIAE